MNPARTIALTGSDQAVRATTTTLLGITVSETSGSAAAVLALYDNASAASGTVLATISLAAGQASDLWFGDRGIRAENGIWAEVVSGAVAGSVRVA